MPDNNINNETDEIRKFHQLFTDGIISEEEFNQKKQELMAGSPSRVTAQPTTVSQSAKSVMNNKAIIVPLALIVTAVLGYVIWANVLFGNDKVAYDLMLKAADHFKYPSSVQLVSGQVVDDAMFANISAVNGFGVRSTTCYYVSSTGYVLEESQKKYCQNEGLNVSKINKKLTKELNP